MLPSSEFGAGMVSFCLGEGAHQGPTEFQVGVDYEGGCGVAADDLWLDDAVLESSAPDECPMPGEVLNGELTINDVGWEIDHAELGLIDLDFAAQGGSVNWFFPTDPTCSASVGFRGKLSVPLPSTMANPAIRFVQPPLGGELEMEVRILHVEGEGAPLAKAGNDFCLGSGVAGSTVDFLVELGYVSGGSSCGPAGGLAGQFQSFEIVDQSACG